MQTVCTDDLPTISLSLLQQRKYRSCQLDRYRLSLDPLKQISSLPTGQKEYQRIILTIYF